jgi:1L-myo-inositol 1-phosphate cytidylyltransferase / CDP-L-myo-inositol myo-inositolphosphotransferase
MEDGFVDRYFNRRLSSHLTRWFLKTSITPNQITLISFGVGLVSSLFFWMGEYLYGVVGALVFQASAVLDCCDGEVARIKAQQTPLGQWLDVVCDNIVHVAMFLAMAWATYRVSGLPLHLGLGFLASFGSLLSLRFVLLSEAQSSPGSGFTGPGRVKACERTMPKDERIFGKSLWRKATGRLTNRDFSVILLLFALVGRLDWFLWLAALGSNVFWIILLWLYQKEARSQS